MLTIPLQAIPNQTLSIVLDSRQYNLTFKTCEGITAVSIIRDNILILSNQRAVAGFQIIPYRYLENGNFIISTLNDDLPFYTQFGISQFLIYASLADLEAIRGT